MHAFEFPTCALHVPSPQAAWWEIVEATVENSSPPPSAEEVRLAGMDALRAQAYASPAKELSPAVLLSLPWVSRGSLHFPPRPRTAPKSRTGPRPRPETAPGQEAVVGRRADGESVGMPREAAGSTETDELRR